MGLLEKIIKKLYYETSSERLVKYYRKKGVKIGKDTIIINPRKILIDYSRPELIEIGDHVFLHQGTAILSHDWASWCFVNKYNDFIPSHAKIRIGNNVWLGENVTILKGVSIGDDVVIGCGSIVTKDIPSNSVAVGVPAKVICSMDDYYNKRKASYVEEALEYGVEILKSGRDLTPAVFYDDYPSFVGSHNYDQFDFPYSNVFTKEQFEKWLKHHHPAFESYEDFVKEVKKRYIK